MRNTPSIVRLVALLLAFPGAHHASADDTRASEDKNEIVVFGGVSLLDASRSTDLTLDLPDLGRARGTGPFRRPGGGSIFPVRFEGETTLGSSVLLGARYSRLIKDRLAVEADLSVGPSHERETRGRGCIAEVCIAADDLRERGRGRGGVGFGEGSVTGWRYGAGLAYELTGGDVRPLVTLGAGAVSWDGDRESETDFVLRFGAGLKVYFGRVGARVDVVDHLVLDHFLSEETEHDVHVTAGLLVRF
jgi:hypothetical protein